MSERKLIDYSSGDVLGLLAALVVLAGYFFMPWLVSNGPSATGAQLLPVTPLLFLVPLAGVFGALVAALGLLAPTRNHLTALAVMLLGVLGLAGYAAYLFHNNGSVSDAGFGFWLSLAGLIGLVIQLFLPRADPEKSSHRVWMENRRMAYLLSTVFLAQAAVLLTSFIPLVLGGYYGEPSQNLTLGTFEAYGFFGQLAPEGAGSTPLISVLGLPSLPVLAFGLVVISGLLRDRRWAPRWAIYVNWAFLLTMAVAVVLEADINIFQFAVIVLSAGALFYFNYYEHFLTELERRLDEGIEVMPDAALMPPDEVFMRGLARRQSWSRIWQVVFLLATLVGMVALVALFVNVIDDVFGMVAITSEVPAEEVAQTIADKENLEDLTSAQLAEAIRTYRPARLRVIIRDEFSVVDPAVFTTTPLGEVLTNDMILATEFETMTISELNEEQLQTILGANLSQETLYEYVISDVVNFDIVKTWSLFSTLFDYEIVQEEFDALVAENDYTNAELEFRSWISLDFITSKQSSFPEIAGVRTAIIGTLWIMMITMLVAFPLGVGAAIYLEEYAQGGNWLERIIETNIRNLSGVPSIIYGLLGLAIFVRVFEAFSSGRVDAFLGGGFTQVIALVSIGVGVLIAVSAVLNELRGAGGNIIRVLNGRTLGSIIVAAVTALFLFILLWLVISIIVLIMSGFGWVDLPDTESNGRTIVSASLTMALLILPVIIIASQEAIRAVPLSIRQGSFGLGATKWQTIWRNVLPAAMPGILTGTILSLSRAIGETAPLIVVGASAVIFVDPEGPFAKFTALPIQIWQWTARPQDEFRNIAAAAIVVLLVLLVILNSTAIILRQRFAAQLRG